MSSARLARRARVPPPARGDKRDRLLAAATQVFARHGFFSAQVADIARAAGVAAGTVYLYFRSKDDLLVSIFERTMASAIQEAREALDGVTDPEQRLRRIARLHLARLGADRDLAVVFQVELRQTTKFMARFSTTGLRDYLGLIRDAISEGQRQGAFRREVSPTLTAKMIFGALDEMATNWILSERRYDLASTADAVVDLFVGGLRPLSAPSIVGGLPPTSRAMTEISHSSEPVVAIRPMRVSSVAVLGAGTMGAQIAAHFANAGVPALLLDIDAKTAREGLERARKLKPDPLYSPDALTLIRTGGFDADLAAIADADWIVEAVVERLDVKRALLAKVDAVRRPGSIVSSNTSGIPIAALAEGRSDDFRRHWLGTHFFNPPRYLRLLEVIPTAETAVEVVEAVRWFADHRLGKGVVLARDTPNFIANHVALYGVMRMIEVLAEGEYTVEEIDAITGPALGRPKSATFRTMDIAGLDVLALVVGNLYERLPAGSREAFAVPPLLEALIARGWIGEKAGQGFYKRVKTASGESEIHALDPATLTYRPAAPVRLGALEAAKSIDDVGKRAASLFAGPDKAGVFLRRTLAPTLVYTARVAPEIANHIDDVDRVLQWGFGWELGPFELIDAIGVTEVVEAARQAAGGALDVPPLLAEAMASGRNRIRSAPLPPAGPDLQILRTAKERNRVVKRNAGASLLDLGEGVLAVEFHSKMNAIGGDTIQMIGAGIAEAERNFQALVVGNDAVNFSAGANVMLLLLEAQEGNWDEIDLMVRAFQGATSAVRFAKVPVVVAPAGLALGGGCEVVLHADRVQAAAESYIGLVEVGVGLIPAGGGTKEMLARAVESLPPQADLLPATQRVFETIGFAKVGTSAADAHRIGYLRDVDGTSMNRDRLLWDAKQKALERVREGYQAPAPRHAIRVGGEGLKAALLLGLHLAWRAGRISDHDVVIGKKLAGILSGGALPHASAVSEQHLLDLEREAFVSLCGERKTLERIAHTLKTGKPLRN